MVQASGRTSFLSVVSSCTSPTKDGGAGERPARQYKLMQNSMNLPEVKREELLLFRYYLIVCYRFFDL